MKDSIPKRKTCRRTLSRKRETDDQARQIDVLFPRFPAMINTRSVGYIWDRLALIGLSGTNTAYSRMKVIFFQSAECFYADIYFSSSRSVDSPRSEAGSASPMMVFPISEEDLLHSGSAVLKKYLNERLLSIWVFGKKRR